MSDLDEQELKATRKMNGASKEIEVGEYVRTKQGNIAKVIEFRDELILDREIKFYGVYRAYLNEDELENITKHSKNIIDLIEVGDFVNGRKIERVNDYGEHKRADFNLDFDDCDAVYNDDIKTILTHEQYSQNCFRLEE